MPQHAVQMETFEQGLAALVDDGRLDPAEMALAVLPHFLDRETRVNGVSDDSWLEEIAALFNEHEALNALAGVGRAQRGHPDHEQAVRQRLAEAGLLCILDVVVDRM